MRDSRNIRETANTGIDWMGFIFYPKSPRYVFRDKTVSAGIHDCPLIRVGVFVNAPTEQMIELAVEYKLDYLQLHGKETPDECYALQKRGFKVIKVFSVASKEDLLDTHQYEGNADYFLFDTKCAEYGGSGQSFDWSVLSAYEGDTPFLLSGGISPESLEAVINYQHPQLAGVDLNSGFEISPAYKDVDKIASFTSSFKKSKTTIQ